MAERYLFFNSIEISPGVYDREYQENDFADYFGKVLSSGLLHTNNNPNLVVAVQIGTMNTIISAGSAIIKGHLYENTTPLTLVHSIPEPSLDRIDRIVLRLDLKNSERNVKLHVKEGISSANPVVPSLQRDNFVHELSLAQIRVRKNTVQLLGSDIKDERLDENLCGLVHSLISIPSDQLQNWITARISELGIVADKGLSDYLQAVVIAEDALQEAMSQHLTEAQGLYDNYSSQLQTKLTQFQTDFNTWFQGLKDQLSTNVALSLQNQINIINAALPGIEQSIADVEGGVATVQQNLAMHMADYTSHVRYGSASAANAKTITLNPAPTTIAEGMALSFKNVTQNTAAVTLNVNGLGAKPVLKANGMALTSGSLKALSIYTVRFNGTSFILQGEGGDYGTASAHDVRIAKTLGTENGIIQGTLDLSKLIPENIRVDVIIDGVTGSLDIASLGGKRWANGTVNSGNSADLRFTYAWNTVTNFDFYITVSGLGFIPSVIYAVGKTSDSKTYFAVFSKLPDGSGYTPTIKTGSVHNANTLPPINMINYKANVGEAYVNGNGFRMPVGINSVAFEWVAFE